MAVPWLKPEDPFPPLDQALEEPDGLLAASTDLHIEQLIAAYQSGIFPWYEEGQPVMWWSPDPRLVLYPGKLRVSRSLTKLARNSGYRITFDREFDAVISQCANMLYRRSAADTWITTAMCSAYGELHRQGLAHSVEVWSGEQLVGGLYGVAMGQVFFGESMFSGRSNTSKLALLELVGRLQTWKYRLIDCQVSSDHLLSLGAELISRKRFSDELSQAISEPPSDQAWLI